MSPISNRLLSSPKTTIQWQPRHEDKSTGREEKGGKLKWESGSGSCGEANFVLSRSFRVSTWTWTDNVRALHLLLPLLTQLIFPVQILEGSLDWLLLHQGQQVKTLFLQHKPVSLCLLTAAGKGRAVGGTASYCSNTDCQQHFSKHVSSLLGILKINSSWRMEEAIWSSEQKSSLLHSDKDAVTTSEGLGIG